MRVNFGSFFNIWDRLMGTFEDATIEERAETASNSVPAPMSARQRPPVDRLPSRKAG
jgi:sterol desaturase/sphingolipid hydroxylase (fatty acid hydroxylase superfamily)